MVSSIGICDTRVYILYTLHKIWQSYAAHIIVYICNICALVFTCRLGCISTPPTSQSLSPSQWLHCDTCPVYERVGGPTVWCGKVTRERRRQDRRTWGQLLMITLSWCVLKYMPKNVTYMFAHSWLYLTDVLRVPSIQGNMFLRLLFLPYYPRICNNWVNTLWLAYQNPGQNPK